MVDYVVATCPTYGYFEDSTCIFGCSVLGKRDLRTTTLHLELGDVHHPGVWLLVVLA